MHAQDETRLVVAVRFPRRKRLRQILILPGLVAVLTGLRLEPALGWGSFMGGGYDTHQRIEAKAYAALVSDPAFYPGALPSLDELQKYAGMTVKEGKTFGLGPDVDGNSRYAEHWYNPRTGEGDGPQAVSSYALHSVELKRADAKMTEWGAHYLADMSTPVHINGATFKTIFEIYSKTNQADTNAPVLLSSNITGFVSYAELHPTLSDTLFHRRSPNWRPEIKRFIAAHLEDKEHVDFFDPWYWDSETKPATTHAQWEMRVPELSGKVPVYSTDWENGKEDFYRYAAIYAEQAAKFAGKAAANTLTINREIQAGQQSSDIALAAMETAVVNVYTLWRGSFSALRPGILIEYPAENDGKKMIKVTGVVTNCAAEQVTKVRCRLSYWDPHESVIRNKPVVSYGSISGISQGVKTGQKVGEWFLESDDTE
ncbi:MAG: hypothetical protein NTY53_25985 [Kiritimatiellaeota bacterium]|nr:hypothetical protein [Kiritimatiellota bacterium]